VGTRPPSNGAYLRRTFRDQSVRRHSAPVAREMEESHRFAATSWGAGKTCLRLGLRRRSIYQEEDRRIAPNTGFVAKHRLLILERIKNVCYAADGPEGDS
jgi:hypothetical protein